MIGDAYAHISRIFGNRRAARSNQAGETPATPAEPATIPSGTYEPPNILFVQSFQSGELTKIGDRHTLTLEHGLGQTIYFSDRPDRIVGTAPTATFLDTLGFPPDNPPNAALIVDDGVGGTDISVIELFAPTYEVDGPTVTYEVAFLENWIAPDGLGLNTTPIAIDDIPSSFGTAHLFIDGLIDCADAEMYCRDIQTGALKGTIPNSDHDGYCRSGFFQDWNFYCLPCAPWYERYEDALVYWSSQCNQRFWCNGQCEASPINT